MAPYQSSPPACPALYLYPLNDTFIPKQIALGGGVRVKIGRQTNAKTVPGERNGFFDSKVLSRQHAEVWEENGKIYIKDVKSSNGTFINGDRLSAESVESEPCELKSEDIVEFGIDIVGEDNKTIIHHKVATRVFVVLTPEDAAAAAREHHAHLQHQQQAMFAQHQQQHQHQQAQQAQAIARRQQGPLGGNNSQLGGLGGLGQSQARPGSKGLSFEHILSKLQMELQKSRETGAELTSLTSAMSEIHDTMGGGAVPPPPPQHQLIPPVRPPTQPDPEQSATGGAAAAQAAMSAMQTQLRETQSSLQAHVDKIHALERLVEEHEAIKREVDSMRELLSRSRSPLPLQLQIEEGEGDLGQHGGTMLAHRRGSEEEYDDDSDVRSVCTVTPETEEEHDERERHSVGRPKTPEPTGHGLMDDEHHQGNPRVDRNTAVLHDQNAMLAARLEALTAQLEQAIAVSQGLQTHAARASSTIAALEAKVNALEEEQRASRVLGGQLPTAEPVSVSKNESSESELTQVMKSELMREMERRWDAWRARTEEEREAEKRTLAAALDEVRAVVDGHKRATERVEGVEARIGVVEGQLAGIEQANTRVDRVNATVEEISALVREVDSRVGDVDSRMLGIEEQARDVQVQVAEMRREGRTRADAVRAISGAGGSIGLGHPGESSLRSDSSSTLDASSPSVRKRVRKRSSRGSSGEDSSSLASSMTHEGSVSTRATSPSEDECEDEDGDTRRVERTPTKNGGPPASTPATASSGPDSAAAVAREPGKHGLAGVGGVASIKDVPAPVLSAAAVAVVAIGVGAWMMTHRVKD